MTQLTGSDRTCQNCAAYQWANNNYRCKRNAPQIDQAGHATWPIVSATDGCIGGFLEANEFRHRTDADAIALLVRRVLQDYSLRADVQYTLEPALYQIADHLVGHRDAIIAAITALGSNIEQLSNLHRTDPPDVTIVADTPDPTGRVEFTNEDDDEDDDEEPTAADYDDAAQRNILLGSPVDITPPDAAPAAQHIVTPNGRRLAFGSHE